MEEKERAFRVRLIRAPEEPFALSIATARSCYSSIGILLPEDMFKDERAGQISDRVAKSTMAAGHLTTRQHPHFVFAIEGVSRHLVWSLLHSHPYYNSEQVSQRYVAVKEGAYHTPQFVAADGAAFGRSSVDAKKLKQIYKKAADGAVTAYHRLTEALFSSAAEEYYRIFPARARNKEKWDREVTKRAMEAARYILPVATHTFLYHTVHALTLYRYARYRHWFDLPGEAAELIDAMIERVVEYDPRMAVEIPEPVSPEDTLEFRILKNLSSGRQLDRNRARKFVKSFDNSLGAQISLLEGYTQPPRSRNRNLQHDSPEKESGSMQFVEEGLKAAFGMPDNSTGEHRTHVAYLLDPVLSPDSASTLGDRALHRGGRALSLFSFVFRKKLSHTADSQNQRHRTTPGLRPLLMTHYTGEVDAVIPALLETSPAAGALYREALESLFASVEELLHYGGSEEEAVYLLPNAFPVRYFESGDLGGYLHRWKHRSCYTAQEEIFRSTLEEIRQVEEEIPSLKGYFRPPCVVRNAIGAAPICPEGVRFCGVQVWKLPLENYQRVI